MASPEGPLEKLREDSYGTERVIAVSDNWNIRLTESYDRITERYAEQFVHELDQKPFD